jgi:hypothetical protein
MSDIKLGNKVRDRVTGFEGIAIAKCEYLNGCVQWGIRPPQGEKKDAYPEAMYIDSQQVEFVDQGIAVEQRVTGGPSNDAPKGYGLGR